MTQKKLNKILEDHKKWLNKQGGKFANLRGVDLRGFDLIYANLSHANLSYVDLSYANLRGSDLIGVDLTNTVLPDSLSLTKDPNLKSKILEEVNKKDCDLDMDDWHTCETTHCIAGWAVTLHPDGKRLEEKSDTYLAGRLLLGLDHEESEIFFSDNDEAMEWLEEV